MPHEVFIAYSSKDSREAKVIDDHLSRFGLRCFRAIKNIPGSPEWISEIAAALKICHAVVIVVSDNSAVSEYVERESMHAAKLRKQLVPVFLYKDVHLSDWMEILFAPLEHIYPIPSLDAALPSIAKVVLAVVDKSKHKRVYNDAGDVQKRSNFHKDIRFVEDRVGLYVGEADSGITTIENGAYVMAAKTDDFLGHEMKSLPKITEFVFEAQITKFQGPDDQWFGFEFGERYPGNYYQFLLTGEGTVRISKHWKKQWKDLASHKGLRHLRLESGENKVRVVRNGKAIHVFVNDLLAISARDWDIRVGRLGLMVGPGIRAAFADIQIKGIDIDAVYAKGIDHWKKLEMPEAKQRLKYVGKFVPAYHHPEHPSSIAYLLSGTRPDRRKTILIVVGYKILPQIHDLIPAMRLYESINRRGDSANYKFARIITDLALIEETKFKQCPLISVGGPATNKITAEITSELPMDPSSTEHVKIQHEIDKGGPRVALWGSGGQKTVEAVNLFISSGLRDKFINMLWRGDDPAALVPPGGQILYDCFKVYKQGSDASPIWKIDSGVWSVTEGGFQGADCEGDYTAIGARSGNTEWTDYTLSLKLKVVSRGSDWRDGAWVGFRYQDKYNAYTLGFYHGVAVLHKISKGKTTMDHNPLGESKLTIADSNWHDVRIRAIGRDIAITLDGKTIIEVTDNNWNDIPPVLTGAVVLAARKSEVSKVKTQVIFNEVQVEAVE